MFIKTNCISSSEFKMNDIAAKMAMRDLKESMCCVLRRVLRELRREQKRK